MAIAPLEDLTGQVTRTYPYPLAYGGNGNVFKATYENYHVAVKVLRISFGRETLCRRLNRETSVWNTVNHPNVVPFLGISCDFDRPDMPCMVSPWFPNGNILQYLRKRPSANKLALLRDIASGLTYLHGRSIVHGDIRGSNILVNDNGQASLLDFGRSRYISAPRLVYEGIAPGNILIGDNSDAHISDAGLVSKNMAPARNFKTGNGTTNIVDFCFTRILGGPEFTTTTSPGWQYRALGPFRDDEVTWPLQDFSPVTTEGWRWIACELMVDSPDESKDWLSHVTMATDVWSFSMTVIEIMTGCIPFSHIKNDASIIVYVISGGRPKRELCPQINNYIWEMLERCWAVDPARRPPMDALSQFFTSRLTGERSRL